MTIGPMAFMSYAHVDNKYGQLAEFRERLSNEVHVQTGDEFPIFVDRDDILYGQPWRQRIEYALKQEVTFIFPILTPSFFKSKACREEIELFLEREKTLGREDLILPVYYVNCQILGDEALRQGDQVANVIASRQWADWRGLRFEPFTSPQVGRALSQLATHVQLALERRSRQKRPTPAHASTELTRQETTIYMVFASEDQGLREQLEVHLAELLRRNGVARWSFHSVDVDAAQWAPRIAAEVETAQIILLLVSPAFLASDYVYGPEMQRVLERNETEDARVIPIILRPCDWGGAPFAKLQALPSDAAPITAWRSRDQAFANVARGLQRVVADISSK